jgi:hypothetical protein
MTWDTHDLEATENSAEPVSPSESMIQADEQNDPLLVTTNTEIESTAPPDSLWKRFRRRVMPNASEQVEDYLRRLALLDETVARYPQSPSGYVLRGELHLSAGMIDSALRDFRQGLALAERQLYTEQWGLVMQVMRDRAREGLTQALSLKR